MVQWRTGSASMALLVAAALLSMCSVGYGQVQQSADQISPQVPAPCYHCEQNSCKEKGLTCCDCQIYENSDGTTSQRCQCCPQGYTCCKVGDVWTCCREKTSCTKEGNCLSTQSYISYAVNSTTSCNTCNPMMLTITADDRIDELYIDGVLQTSLVQAGTWSLPDTLEIPAAFDVIAVKASDVAQVRAGILASVTDDYILTNSQWKCTTTNHPGWMLSSFNDGLWPTATVSSNNPGLWPLITGISTNAKWIWTSNFKYPIDTPVYCRGKISKGNGCNLKFGNCSNLCESGTCCGCEFCNFGPTKTCSCCPKGYQCCGSQLSQSTTFSSNPSRYCCPIGSQCYATGKCLTVTQVIYPSTASTWTGGPCNPWTKG